ncbi:CoA transferase [Hymenobacter humi]|uniref:CoA transferase n=1 Tax=Hymenobacter humi TaxID=1411620 RepID=A0ABW2U7Z2_9BACT
MYQREKTGRGSLVHVSLLDSALSALANQAATYLVTGHDPRPMGSGHPSIVPYGTVYRAANGRRLVLAVGSDGQFRQLCAALGQPNWATDARFQTNAARVVHRAELEALLTQRIAAVNGDEPAGRAGTPGCACRRRAHGRGGAKPAGGPSHAAASSRKPAGRAAHGSFPQLSMGGSSPTKRTSGAGPVFQGRL